MAQVSVNDLSRTFRSRGASVHALRSVDLTVPSGEFVVLLGASGSGKTTLLRCVAGLERPDGGRITIGPEVVWDASGRVDIAPNRRNLGMVFQSYALWPHMTVRENVSYPLRVRRLRAELKGNRVDDVLSLVGCAHLAHRYPDALSGGQQQRVALARALAPHPRTLLFDEPLSNIDALLRQGLREQIKQLHREVGFTAIYVTHDQSEALYLGTQVAVMREGVIEQIGKPEDVHRFPVTEALAEFLGARNSLLLDEEQNGRIREQVARRTSGGLVGSKSVRARVRAEHLRLSTSPPEVDAETVVLGQVRVTSVSYAGEWIEYEFVLGEQLLYARNQDRVVAVAPGATAWATASVADVLVYEDERLVHPTPPIGTKETDAVPAVADVL